MGISGMCWPILRASEPTPCPRSEVWSSHVHADSPTVESASLHFGSSRRGRHSAYRFPLDGPSHRKRASARRSIARCSTPCCSYNTGMLEQLRSRARSLKTETHAVYLAAVDRRTPWHARALLLLIVAYALSPIDLIPDFIPVLGYLDDLILIPAGIAFALRLIPAEIMLQARATASRAHANPRIGIAGAVIVALIWAAVIVAILATAWRWIRTRSVPA
jgi:uncharacterized membrane protein YkvA (DUF1232 family)